MIERGREIDEVLERGRKGGRRETERDREKQRERERK